MSLSEKAKTLVDKSPSTIGEPYIHLKLFCVCMHASPQIEKGLWVFDGV